MKIKLLLTLALALLLALAGCDEEFGGFGSGNGQTTVTSVTITADPGGWGEILDMDYTAGDTNSDIICTVIGPGSQSRQLTRLSVPSQGEIGFVRGAQTFRMGFNQAGPGNYKVRCKTADGQSSAETSFTVPDTTGGGGGSTGGGDTGGNGGSTGGDTQPTSTPDTGSGSGAHLVITSMAVTPMVGMGQFTADVHYSGGVSESVHCWIRNDDGSKSITEIGWFDFPSSPDRYTGTSYPVKFNMTAVGDYTAFCETMSKYTWYSYPFTVQQPETPDLSQPFGQPQYLLHVYNRGADGYFLYTETADNGSIILPDGTGGTYGLTIDFSSGPYTTPADVCSVTDVSLKGVSLHAWDSNDLFTCP
jgi:hypothetical protein